jgi:hypothetical protein
MTVKDLQSFFDELARNYDPDTKVLDIDIAGCGSEDLVVMRMYKGADPLKLMGITIEPNPYPKADK